MQQEKIPTVIIVGAGLGGLTIYHALIKNKDKKEFIVKIFERESGPKGIIYIYIYFNFLQVLLQYTLT
jgi:cation diffusion facilitator CzcD-associated flavoprotein CzcO